MMSCFGVQSLRCLVGVGWVVGSAALGVGCRSSVPELEKAAPTSEPERFNFALPDGYGKIELRGEGSESLRAPTGARVTRTEAGFNVEAGADFALAIVSHGETLAAMTGSGVAPGVARVVSEPDLVVFKSEQGYSFVVVRDLVPEWDESQRQQFGCGSAGGAVSGPSTATPMRTFSKPAIEHMVAACRTLVLPQLE